MTRAIVFVVGLVIAFPSSAGVTPRVEAGTAVPAATLSALERQRLVAHLEMTASWLLDESSGLAAAQLDFRPEPDAWSIRQVLEHVVLVGQIYWDDLQAAVARGGETRPSRMNDLDVLWYGIDRTNREKAIPSELPQGPRRELRAIVDEYRRHHSRLLQYIKTTQDDLRGRFVARQGSDAYQWALLITTHEQRHILQIREIKAHQSFPR